MGLTPGVQLLPLRFGFQLAHFIITLLLAASNVDNVQIAISPSTPQHEKQQFLHGYSVILALFVMTLAGLIFEVVSMMKGPTLLRNPCNLISTTCHALGFFSTLWLILSSWTYMAYVYIYVFFSLPPTLLELFFLLVEFYTELVKLLTRIDPRKWEWQGEALLCCEYWIQYCWRNSCGLCNQPAPYV